MDGKVCNLLRNQGDTIHPLDVPERRKIARTPGSLTVYHTTRLCEKLMQPKSEFDLSDPRGFLMSSEYNSLHDPNLRDYLFRKDIHRRLLRKGFITKDDKVVCTLRTLNTYRNYLADVERGWTRRFRTEQKDLVRTFFTLQEKGEISNDMTMSDVTNWLVQSGRNYVVNQNSAAKSRSMSGLRLQQLPAIAKRCSAIEITSASTGRNVLNWTNKGARMIHDVTKEVQREMRVERRWAISKKDREQRRVEQMQKRLKRGKKTHKSKKGSPDKDIENRGGLEQIAEETSEETTEETSGVTSGVTSGETSGETTASVAAESSSQTSSAQHISSSSSKHIAPIEYSAAILCGRRDLLEKSWSMPKIPLDPINCPRATERVYHSQPTSPRGYLDWQHPFSDTRKKLSAICQKLVTEPTLPSTTSYCTIPDKITSAASVPSHLVKSQQSFLEDHFKGVMTPEELQMVLQGIVVSLVEEVNQVLVPAIVAFQYERILPFTSPMVLPPCFAVSSTSSQCTSSKISRVTSSSNSSSSLCTTPEAYVTYPDYTTAECGAGGAPPCCMGPHVSDGSSSSRSSENMAEEERRHFGLKVVAPTASLMLKVESIIKDVIRDSVETFKKEIQPVGKAPLPTIVSRVEQHTVSPGDRVEDTGAKKAKRGVSFKEEPEEKVLETDVEENEEDTEVELGIEKTDVADAFLAACTTDVPIAANVDTSAAIKDTPSTSPDSAFANDSINTSDATSSTNGSANTSRAITPPNGIANAGSTIVTALTSESTNTSAPSLTAGITNGTTAAATKGNTNTSTFAAAPDITNNTTTATVDDTYSTTTAAAPADSTHTIPSGEDTTNNAAAAASEDALKTTAAVTVDSITTAAVRVYMNITAARSAETPITTTAATPVDSTHAIPDCTEPAAVVTVVSVPDSPPLFKKSPENMESTSELPRPEEKDVTSIRPDLGERSLGKVSEESLRSARSRSHTSGSSDTGSEGSSGSGSGSGFVVSLEKCISLSARQVDEVLEKVTTALEEEQQFWLLPDTPDSLEGLFFSSERASTAGVEEMSTTTPTPVLPRPKSLIFAIIQKMQLDNYLQHKLVSFFAKQRLSASPPTTSRPESGSISRSASQCELSSSQPVGSFSYPLLSPDTCEQLRWADGSPLGSVSPHSIKVTRWLLQTIQRRNGWQGTMSSDAEAMDSKQMREKHILCEIIQALLDHLDHLSRCEARKTQSESSLRTPMSGLSKQRSGGERSRSMGSAVSDMSLAASELTKEVMAKLLSDDSD
ncbi:uncharacterized protein LOC134435859 [Engraulis encrasicolus]|uniref:uncharacterized protein LOC134435859 n=1 Tax=Engraulis encrasicolus TaxID=184585 RepID=UPI002FD6A5E7